MPRTAPFEAYHRRYDCWFERHAAAYHSELLAVRALLPWYGMGLAIAVQTVAEALPFPDGCFDYALSVTTICFVDDVTAMLAEAYRVLKPGGELVIGFIDRTSDLGQHYLAHQAGNVFYREATFYSAKDVEQLLRDTGFTEAVWVQTLSKSPEETREIEPLRSGFGQGAFVVARVNRP